MWLDIAMALICCVGGMGAGLMVHAFSGPPLPKGDPCDGGETEADPNDDPSNANDVSPEGSAAAEVDAATRRNLDAAESNQRDRSALVDAAKHLHEYAEHMLSDVSAHRAKVGEINDHLKDGGDQTTAEDLADSVRQLIAANTAMEEQLQAAHDEIERQAGELETAQTEAATDALTGLANRGAFDRHLSQRHAFGVRTDPAEPFAGTLALLDIDHFKRFNDEKGHLAGDEVLRQFAAHFRDRLGGEAMVARYGGEEIALVFDGWAIGRAARVAERARAALSDMRVEFEGESFVVSASMGVAELTADEDGSPISIERWIEAADRGLYRAKEAGRDCGYQMVDDSPVRIGAAADENDGDDHGRSDNDITLDRPDDDEPTPMTSPGETTSDASDDADNDASVPTSTPKSGDVAESSDDTPGSEDTDSPPSSDPEAGSNPPTSSDPPDPSESPLSDLTDETSESSGADGAGEPSPFGFLPDDSAMETAIAELRRRAGDDIRISLMAVRCVRSGDGDADTRSALLPLVRSKLKSNDRLGYLDDETLLVGLPNMDEQGARHRRNELLREAAQMGLDESAVRVESIQLEDGETFVAATGYLRETLDEAATT